MVTQHRLQSATVTSCHRIGIGPRITSVLVLHPLTIVVREAAHAADLDLELHAVREKVPKQAQYFGVNLGGQANPVWHYGRDTSPPVQRDAFAVQQVAR
jgi:hypothetical protein